MHDLLPEGEDLRRAAKWVAGKIQEDPDRPLGPFIHEAIFRFDLSPREAELLLGFFSGRKKEK